MILYNILFCYNIFHYIYIYILYIPIYYTIIYMSFNHHAVHVSLRIWMNGAKAATEYEHDQQMHRDRA